MYGVCPVRHVSPEISGPAVIPGGSDNIFGIFQCLFLRDQTGLIFVVLCLQHTDHTLYLALNHLIQLFLLGNNHLVISDLQRYIGQQRKQKYS